MISNLLFRNEKTITFDDINLCIRFLSIVATAHL